MPELPEVETIRRGLAPHLEGRVIESIKCHRKDLRFPFPKHFEKRLTGARILPLQRRAKYLIAPLDTGESLIVHLGMSGRLILEREEAAENPGRFHHGVKRINAHDHVIFALNGGARLIYNDVRRFGFMLLVGDHDMDAHPAFITLGIEPLGNDFNAEALLARFQGKKTPLKSALLDQRLIAGLGNIYVCEAMHRAGLSPHRAAQTLGFAEAIRLVRDIRDVLNEALEAGGSSLRDGSTGYFQHEFRAYDREGAPCTHVGCSGHILRTRQAGRSTFYCATCQG
jgi:formamidopyrimidine-DNA glycosylase